MSEERTCGKIAQVEGYPPLVCVLPEGHAGLHCTDPDRGTPVRPKSANTDGAVLRYEGENKT